MELYRQQLIVFLFVLARIAGLVLATPALGARTAPKYSRIVLAVAVALMITPVFADTVPPRADHAFQLLLPLAREAVLGLVMGLALLILIAGIKAAGQVIGQMSGLSLAQLIDPDTGAPSTVIGQLFALVATAVFLISGGHRQLLAAVLDTFRWMPPGHVGFSAGLVTTLTEVAGQSFLLALRVAAPVLVALLLSTLVLGLIGRALPQVNVLALGLGLNSMIAMATLGLSLAAAVWIFQEHADTTIRALTDAMEACRESNP